MSHAVFVPDIDDEHKEIFEAVAGLQKALAGGGEIRELTAHLTNCIVDHFAHEERLMRAARYSSFRWHKLQHDGARRRVVQFIQRVEQGDTEAGTALVEYLSGWLRDHTRLADRMMGAFLRNQRLWKLTFQAGTKPADACEWVDVTGARFQPAHRP
jgi:hemerythrin